MPVYDRRFVSWAGAVLALCSSAYSYADLSPRWYQRVIVLGDSVSDTGNVWELTNRNDPISPPYFEGRFSNGPVWVEHLADRLHVDRPEPSLRGGTNYAYGGAQIGYGETANRSGEYLLPTVGSQVEDYLSSSAPSEHDLFIVKAGYNNFGFGGQTDHQAVAGYLEEHVRSLHAGGARNFLLSGLYNGAGGVRDAFNSVWRKTVQQLDDELEGSFVYLNWASGAAQFWSRASDYGVTNLNLADSALDPDTLEVAENPQRFFCWDQPSCHQPSNVHEFFAKYAYEIALADDIGDFDRSGTLDVEDINLLGDQIRRGSSLTRLDLNDDGQLSDLDWHAWVERAAGTFFGDANLDGEFNSGDFVDVFTAGEYEDTIPENSGWASGDWDGDGDFTSSDFVVAFTDGGYEQGPRMDANAVPEPTSFAIILAALIGFVRVSRSRGKPV